MERGTNACLLWSPQWRISCQSIKCNMFLTADVFFLSLLPFFCNMCLFIAVCLRQYCWSSVHVRYLIAVMINHRWSAALFSQAKHYVDLILWSLEIFCTSSKLQMDWLWKWSNCGLGRRYGVQGGCSFLGFEIVCSFLVSCIYESAKHFSVRLWIDNFFYNNF